MINQNQTLYLLQKGFICPICGLPQFFCISNIELSHIIRLAQSCGQTIHPCGCVLQEVAYSMVCLISHGSYKDSPQYVRIQLLQSTVFRKVCYVSIYVAYIESWYDPSTETVMYIFIIGICAGIWFGVTLVHDSFYILIHYIIFKMRHTQMGDDFKQQKGMSVVAKCTPPKQQPAGTMIC